MALDKFTQIARVMRHLLRIFNQPNMFGTVEIQIQNSVPIYISTVVGQRTQELEEGHEDERFLDFIKERLT